MQPLPETMGLYGRMTSIKKMFCYFSVSLVLKRFSKALKESRNQTGTNCQELN